MPTTAQLLQYALYIAAAIAMGVFLRWRRKSHTQFLQQFAQDEVCDHLRPALDLLRSRGHVVIRAGQSNPDSPLEIHLAPPFDPKAIADELQLQPPAHLSERNVIYCKEDWCELHPR